MSFHETKLENGLTVIGEHHKASQCAAIGFFVKTGSRDETPEIAGVSHFLEHMMFKGTAKRSALDITYQLAAIGAQSNAYTNEENTVYYVYVLPEYFDTAFEILSDMLRPALDENEFNTEKKVILEEIALYEDRPTFKLYEAAMREYFYNHPAGNSVLGTTETVGGISVGQMRRYFDSRYSPENITLSVSGQFDWERVCELSDIHCGHWDRHDADREVKPHMPTAREKILTKENLQMSHMCLMGEGPAAGDDMRYAAYVLACILGDSTGSRTYWELVDKGLAEGAAVDSEDMDGVGMVYSFVSARPEALDDVGEILQKIMRTPMEFSDDDLERAKTKIATRLVLQGESSMRRLMAIGVDWTYRQQYHSIESELKRLQSVSRKEIESMLAHYSFTPTTKVKMVPA
ncbi:MAG: insulinase family protein [Bdellovibrionales bacterium]|nr:insulinase family protein [Bdellovibrionales bacterium]